MKKELQQKPLARYFPAEIFSTEALRWALGCVFSRGFNIDGNLRMVSTHAIPTTT